MRTARMLAIVLLTALAVVSSGCSLIAEKAAETAIEKTTGVSVDEKDGSVKFEKDGESIEVSGEKAEVPEDFPKDFPLYDGEVDTAGAVKANEGQTFSVRMLTDEKAREVYDWQIDALEDAGYSITTSATMEQDGKTAAVIGFKKGEDDAEAGMVNVTEGDGDAGRTVVDTLLNIKK